MRDFPEAIKIEELSELITRRRAELSLLGRDAADSLGIEPQLLAAWERGERLTKIVAFLALLTEVYEFDVKFVPHLQWAPRVPAGNEKRTRYSHRVSSTRR